MKKYIHYGSKEYFSEKVTDVVMSIRSKPDRGLWGSPIDSDWGWEDWCESENWFKHDMDQFFEFSVKDSAKILEIHKEEDILDYIVSNSDSSSFRSLFGTCTDICDELNMDKLIAEFDGMELFLSDDYTMHNGIFNLWDCDCIVVWNPDVIVAL